MADEHAPPPEDDPDSGEEEEVEENQQAEGVEPLPDNGGWVVF